MRRWLLIVLVTAGCGGQPPHHPETPHAEAGWMEHYGALFVRVRPPFEYLATANLMPFHIRVGGLQRSRSRWQHAEPFEPISDELYYAWRGEVRLNLFLNTERFVRHGFFYVRPYGLTRVPNPLYERCPENLLQAAVSDMRGRNQLILEPHLATRDSRYGCVYRFRYIVD